MQHEEASECCTSWVEFIHVMFMYCLADVGPFVIEVLRGDACCMSHMHMGECVYVQSSRHLRGSSQKASSVTICTGDSI